MLKEKNIGGGGDINADATRAGLRPKLKCTERGEIMKQKRTKKGIKKACYLLLYHAASPCGPQLLAAWPRARSSPGPAL